MKIVTIQIEVMVSSEKEYAEYLREKGVSDFSFKKAPNGWTECTMTGPKAVLRQVVLETL